MPTQGNGNRWEIANARIRELEAGNKHVAKNTARQLRAIEAATIERCAQAVMDHGGGNAIWHAEAIRALKAPGKEGE